MISGDWELNPAELAAGEDLIPIALPVSMWAALVLDKGVDDVAYVPGEQVDALAEPLVDLLRASQDRHHARPDQCAGSGRARRRTRRSCARRLGK